MIPYLLYPKHFPDCPDNSTKTQIETARAKALEEAKKELIKQLKANFNKSQLVISKDQWEPDAVRIEIKGDDWDGLGNIFDKLRSLSIVAVMDSFASPPVKENSKDIKRFLK